MEYLQPLVTSFEANANAENAEPMKRYMRDKFEFLGIKAPDRRSLFKEFTSGHGLPTAQMVEPALRQLWQLPYREYQYCGVDLLDRVRRQLGPDTLELCSTLITTKSWWDTVDGLAANVVGHLLRTFPERRDDFVDKCRSSSNIWLRRTAIIFQLKYGHKTDWDLLAQIAVEHAGSKEFFIQKAVGWALRQYSKYEPDTVTDFVGSTDLAPLSKREAMKWIASRK